MWRRNSTLQPRFASTVGIFCGILGFSLAGAIIVGVLNHTPPQPVHSTTSSLFEAFRTVPTPEIPALAIHIIQMDDVAQRDAQIQKSLEAGAVLARPGVLPYLVSALLRQFPDRLETILDTAMDLRPDLVLIYAQAGMVQVPGQVEEVSYVLGKKSPWNAAAIARTLAEETRDSDAILRGLKRAFPAYNPSMNP